MLNMTIDRKGLDKACKMLKKVCKDNSRTMDVLKHVLVEAGPDGIRLSVTDLEAWLTLTVPGSGVGTFCTNLKGLYDCIKGGVKGDVVRVITEPSVYRRKWGMRIRRPQRRAYWSFAGKCWRFDGEGRERFTVEVKAGGAVVHVGAARVKVSTIDPAEFPSERTGYLSITEFDGATLGGMLAETVYAAGDNDTRYVLNGVHLTLDAARVRVVGTDGHRLAVSERSGLDGYEGGGFEGIVPKASAVVLGGLVGPGAVKVSVSGASWQYGKPGPSSVRLYGAGWALTTRLIEGTYPDWQRIMPNEADTTATLTVDAPSFAALCSRIVTHPKTNAGRFKINGACILEGIDPERSWSETFAGEHGGDNIDIGFNCHYLHEAAKSMGAGSMTIKMQDINTPAVIRRDGLTVVVMPLRV